jgi:hypothetical protein
VGRELMARLRKERPQVAARELLVIELLGKWL